jgi:hypothetical protein
MNTSRTTTACAVLLAALGAPLAAHAQSAAPPIDPAAPVPALVYESALEAAPRSADPALTPDKVWRAANDALWMAPGLAGHAGHGAQRPSPTHPASEAPPPATPPERQSTSPADAGHAHHQH